MSKRKPTPGVDEAFGRLAALFENGELMASSFPVQFLDNAVDEITRLRASIQTPEALAEAIVRAARDCHLGDNATRPCRWRRTSSCGHRSSVGGTRRRHPPGHGEGEGRIVNTAALLSAARACADVVDKRSPVDVMKLTRLVSDGGWLTLSAMDATTQVSSTVPFDGSPPWTCGEPDGVYPAGPGR